MNAAQKFWIRAIILIFALLIIERLASTYIFYDEFPPEKIFTPRYWSHLENLTPIRCPESNQTLNNIKIFYVTRNSPLVFPLLIDSSANYSWTQPQSGNITLSATQRKTIWFTYQPKRDFFGCDSFLLQLRTSSSVQVLEIRLHVVIGPSLTQGILNVPQNFRLAQMSLAETANIFYKLRKPSIKHRLPIHEPFLQKRFTTCAIVGNGGVLKGRSNGREIDEHEVVFRINSSPIEPYVKDVGSKTTFMWSAASRYIRCWTWKDYPNLMKIPHSVYGQIPMDVSFFRDCLDEFETKYPHIQLHLISHEWMMLADEIIREYIGNDRNETKSKLRSTGMMVFMAASVSCDKISIYGFKDSPEGHHHYWENVPDTTRAWERHTYDAEQEFFHDVATENYEKFEKYLWPYNLTKDIVFVTN